MKEERNKTRLIAALGTLVIVAVVAVWMVLTVVAVSSSEKKWPPEHKVDITLDDEQYVDVLNEPVPVPSLDQSTKAYDEVEENNLSEAAEPSGLDLKNEGPKGEAVKPVTQEKPSPVKVRKPKEEKQVKEGPKEDTKTKEKTQARRKATADVKNAFGGKGHNNTTNKGKKPGDSGSPNGGESSVNGKLKGNAGSGWSLPGYGLITSPVTGTVKVKVTILSDGTVPPDGVQFIGGTPPAATNPTTRANVRREILSKRFHRSNDRAPETATAYITVNF